MTPEKAMETAKQIAISAFSAPLCVLVIILVAVALYSLLIDRSMYKVDPNNINIILAEKTEYRFLISAVIALIITALFESDHAFGTSETSRSAPILKVLWVGLVTWFVMQLLALSFKAGYVIVGILLVGLITVLVLGFTWAVLGITILVIFTFGLVAHNINTLRLWFFIIQRDLVSVTVIIYTIWYFIDAGQHSWLPDRFTAAIDDSSSAFLSGKVTEGFILRSLLITLVFCASITIHIVLSRAYQASLYGKQQQEERKSQELDENERKLLETSGSRQSQQKT